MPGARQLSKIIAKWVQRLKAARKRDIDPKNKVWNADPLLDRGDWVQRTRTPFSREMASEYSHIDELKKRFPQFSIPELRMMQNRVSDVTSMERTKGWWDKQRMEPNINLQELYARVLNQSLMKTKPGSINLKNISKTGDDWAESFKKGGPVYNRGRKIPGMKYGK